MTTIFDRSKSGRRGFDFGPTTIDYSHAKDLVSDTYLRKEKPALPEVSENIVVRHYTNLSRQNYGVDNGIYPLGSCTMKYNPKINDFIASNPMLTNSHPLWPEGSVQGLLEILYELQNYLMAITGMAAVTLEPSAGSQGELTGLMIIKKYLEDKGLSHKKIILIPDSAHGTNPASVTMAGFETLELKSTHEGLMDLEAMKEVLNDDVAGLMLTNPNTLGLFEKDIRQIADMVHSVGGLLYYDGANMNANMCITRPYEMGFDIVHLNLHKTFSTPHGGGGPGSGPVGVVESLKEYLPSPLITKTDGSYSFVSPKHSIGKVKQFYGNIGILIRAYVYIHRMGAKGLKQASQYAVLNANYMLERLKDHYVTVTDQVCKHEFVLAGLKDKNGCHTIDIAKRLIDYGVHPPTIYFPLIVEEALMIEPTESEPLESLDTYVDLLIRVAEEAKENPDLLRNAPVNSSVRRLDEVGAARNPQVTYDLLLASKKANS